MKVTKFPIAKQNLVLRMDQRVISCSISHCEIKSALDDLPEILFLPDEQNEIIVSMNDYVTVSKNQPRYARL